MLDADVLPSLSALRRFVAAAAAQPTEVFHCQTWILDRFDGFRYAGNRLYRTSVLPEALATIPRESSELRPESRMIHNLEKRGHHTVMPEMVLGLHDFEQTYADIRRTCFLHSIKHARYLQEVVPNWKERAAEEPDFLAAIQGFAAGVLSLQPFTLDADRLSEEAQRLADWHDFPPEKLPLNPAADIEALIVRHLAAAGEPDYVPCYTATPKPPPDPVPLRRRLGDRIRRLGPLRTALWSTGRVAEAAGTRIRLAAEQVGNHPSAAGQILQRTDSCG